MALRERSFRLSVFQNTRPMPRSSYAWVSSSSLDSVLTAVRQAERAYQVPPISRSSSAARKS